MMYHLKMGKSILLEFLPHTYIGLNLPWSLNFWGCNMRTSERLNSREMDATSLYSCLGTIICQACQVQLTCDLTHPQSSRHQKWHLPHFISRNLSANISMYVWDLKGQNHSPKKRVAANGKNCLMLGWALYEKFMLTGWVVSAWPGYTKHIVNQCF